MARNLVVIMAKQSKLIGIDFAGICRKAGEQLQAEHDATFEREQNRLADVERRAASVSHDRTYFAAVSRCGAGFRAISIEHPPFVGELQAVARTPEAALKELKFAYAQKLLAERLIADWDDCRAHACKATFIRALDLGGL